MKLKSICLFSICLIATSAFIQNDFSNTSSFRLKGNVQSVDIFVQSYSLQKNEKHQAIITDTVCLARYEFSKNGNSTFIFDTIPLVYKPEAYAYLDSLLYIVTLDSFSNNLIATRKFADTINEFEVRYRLYNDSGLLETDSICYGQYIEFGFTQGPIVKKYLYDLDGNVIYFWFKSSFVFAIRDHWIFTYEYDEIGNWIKMTRSYVSANSSQPLKLIDLENLVSTPEWAVFRTIKYY